MFKGSALVGVAALAMVAVAPQAEAHGDRGASALGWGLLGAAVVGTAAALASPPATVVVPAQPVYAYAPPPAVVYAPPPAVVYAPPPPPVYYAPAPVVVYHGGYYRRY